MLYSFWIKLNGSFSNAGLIKSTSNNVVAVIKNIGVKNFEITNANKKAYNKGLVRWNNRATITNCYANRIIIITGADSDNGELVGHTDGSIINSYATNVTITGEFCNGGLVGVIDESGGKIINSYAIRITINNKFSNGGLID